MSKAAALALPVCLCSLLLGGCDSTPRPPAHDTDDSPATQPTVAVGPAVRPEEPPAAEGVLAYYGAVIRGYVRAESGLREAELRSCFNVGLAARFGEQPSSAEEVREILDAGGYDFRRLPAGHGITYDPNARKVFLLKRAAD